MIQSLTTMDYLKLGLKCGLEIHQQLEGKKLFCSCPTILRDNQPDFTIHRKLRASAGESGEIDIAATQEQNKNKTFLYEGYIDSTCLVETDSEPPHPLNTSALHTTLQFSLLTQTNVVTVIQVMRKVVIDGSNTSGFQRTALVACKGKLTTSEGDVRITTVSLEEDACRSTTEIVQKADNGNTDKKPDNNSNKNEVSTTKRDNNEKVYRLDRLGIPLIEIATDPDIKSPEQCQETAKKIGLLLRSLPGVKRGLGTIRQDINISIAGGSRIEIKGAQDLKMIPLWVELEAKRQLELLKIKDELRGVRLVPLNGLNIVDLSTVLRDSPSKIVRKALDNKNHKDNNNKIDNNKIDNSKIDNSNDNDNNGDGNSKKETSNSNINDSGKVMGIILNNFAGYLGRELQPNYRLGTELSGRAKIIAGVGGIFHSDELPNYGITAQDISIIRKKLKCEPRDAFVLVADSEVKCRKALQAVHNRALEVMIGIPSEVRKPNADGTTAYMRPMPGSSRMYPETDVPLIHPDTSHIELPETIEKKIKRFQQQLNLSADLANFMAKSEEVFLFEELIAKHPKIKAAFIAETLLSTPLEIKRNYNLDSSLLTNDNFRNLFMYLEQEKIHKDIVIDVLIDMLKGSFAVEKYATLSTEDIHHQIKNIIQQNKNAPFSALMGLCVRQLAGKASGKVIAEELKRMMEQK